MRKATAFILNHPFYLNLTEKLSRLRVTPDKLPLLRILHIFSRQLAKDNIAERASSMAFNFTLSIFPTIIFVFTLVPYIPLNNLAEDMMGFMKDNMPTSIYEVASSTIYDILKIPHGGLLSFGFAFALFSATNGIRVMITAFNRCYRTSDKRGFFKLILISTLLAIFLSVIIFFAVAMSIFIKVEFSELKESFSLNEIMAYYLFMVSKQLFLFLLFFFGFSLIYYVAPSVTTRWRFFSAGSLIASILSVLFSGGFFYYINNFNSYNKVYGSIGAIIGVMMWLYAISILLLIGFEINASIDMVKREEKQLTSI